MFPENLRRTDFICLVSCLQSGQSGRGTEEDRDGREKELMAEEERDTEDSLSLFVFIGQLGT